MKIYIAFALCFLFLLLRCTDNPFSKNSEITENYRSITGSVQLSHDSDFDGVYVWLENFDMGTYTDIDGNFKLTLPSPQSQPGGGVSGLFDLYFYVANYEIRTAKVAVRAGAFVYGEADINNNGNLNFDIHLPKLLDIKSYVTPDTIFANYSGYITVTIRLMALNQAVAIKLFLDKDDNITGLYVRKIDSGEVWDTYLALGASSNTEIISLTPIHMVSTYFFKICSLPKGRYELIPFIWIDQNNVPPDLLDNLTVLPVSMSSTYLELPFKRENALLRIAHCDHNIGDPPM